MRNQDVSRKRSFGHYFPRYLAVVLLIVGIVTAALNAKFGGFTPIMWFLLALAVLVIITCGEVLRIADFLESKK
jgi:cation transport ATPase